MFSFNVFPFLMLLQRYFHIIYNDLVVSLLHVHAEVSRKAIQEAYKKEEERNFEATLNEKVLWIAGKRVCMFSLEGLEAKLEEFLRILNRKSLNKVWLLRLVYFAQADDVFILAQSLFNHSLHIINEFHALFKLLARWRLFLFYGAHSLCTKGIVGKSLIKGISLFYLVKGVHVFSSSILRHINQIINTSLLFCN